MGCGCNKNKNSRSISQPSSGSVVAKSFSVMGNYKYLTSSQISARLEVFKRMYCKSCESRYNCTFETYNLCTIRPQH